MNSVRKDMKHLVAPVPLVTPEDRQALSNHPPLVLWFTGLSGSGKSTLAHQTERELYRLKYRTYVIDADVIRQGLCRDLGFSLEDRSENVRRVAEVAKILTESGVIVLVALISPLRVDRQIARSIFPSGVFKEVYCSASLEECKKRDVKGFYEKAKYQEIENFTGISSPYEVPYSPDLKLRTGEKTVEATLQEILEFLEHNGISREPLSPHI